MQTDAGDTRTGPCTAYTCTRGCSGFSLAKKVGVHPVCACGHTQSSHKNMAVPAEEGVHAP